MMPSERRSLFHRLAAETSKAGPREIDEERFLSIIDHEFQGPIRRHGQRQVEILRERYFLDARSSATLTTRGSKWTFSHNSLREFLVVESLAETLETGKDLSEFAAIRWNDGMIVFATARLQRSPDLLPLLKAQVRKYPELIINLFLRGLLVKAYKEGKTTRQMLESLLGIPPSLREIAIEGVNFEKMDLSEAIFSGSLLDRVHLNEAKLTNTIFTGAIINSTNLSYADLSGADFTSAELVGLDLTGANLKDTRFIRSSIKSIKCTDDLVRSDDDARAWLAWQGADVGPRGGLNLIQFSTYYPVIKNVVDRLADGRPHQATSVAQRGMPPHLRAAGKKFLNELIRKGYAKENLDRKDQVIGILDKIPVLKKILEGHIPDDLQLLFPEEM
jgi:uncharacterized protein YjbI with pentapeptide repeats